jgi:hypothetical protein
MRRLLSPRMARMLAIAVAGGRAALGVTAMVAPDAVARPWIGDDGRGPGRRVLARALGGRDLALGLGALLAARPDGPLRGWVEAGGLADAGDVAATFLAFRHLPERGRWLVLAAAGGAVAAAALAAPSL